MLISDYGKMPESVANMTESNEIGYRVLKTHRIDI